jgi:hypothetical protein
MDTNINHPSVSQFLTEITQNIVANISVEKYFELSEEKKIGISYFVLKLIKSSVEKKTKLNDMELKTLLGYLWRKNESAENYEIAAILINITKNYELINEQIKPTRRPKKDLKMDTNNNQ